MAIPPGHKANFETLLRAARDGRLSLMECTCAKTGEPRYVICAVQGEIGGTITMVPFGHMFEGDNPFENYLPPA